MKETLHLYLRVSSQVQETEGTSLVTQEQCGIELSKQLGMDFKIHNEGGSSSNSDNLDNRPVMMNLLKLMDEGVVKNLYVWNTDRISRNQITFFTIRQKMIKNGVILYTSGGRYNSENYMENMILGILSEVSQYDNKVRTERSRLGKLEMVKQNFWRGGDAPFGYMLEPQGIANRLVENENESKWIRYIYQQYSVGTSLKEIKKRLEKEHVLTRRGHKMWSLGTLQVILKNDTYLGVDTFYDKKSKLTITNAVPQIISSKLWEEAQDRRKQILKRKNQLNKSKNFYLFRDFMECSCGTPIGGRVNQKKYVRHYYCPLSERKFNKATPDTSQCHMKRCLNIPSADTILWNHIVSILSDTVNIKNKMTEAGLFGLGKSLEGLEVEKQKVSEEIDQLKKVLKKIERGLVAIETKKIMNDLPDPEIYNGIKKNLSKQYRSIQLTIEDLNNQKILIGNDVMWFDGITKFGEAIGKMVDIGDIQKKELLKVILKKIVVDYDNIEKVHLLVIHFRLPVIIGDMGSILTSKILLNSSSTIGKAPDQLFPLSHYSTVTDFAKFRGWSTLQPRMTAMW